MTNQAPEVEQFIQDLDHPLKSEVVRVREIILDAQEGLTEQIKWNAPSFCYQGEDRITFKLHPPRAVQLVFHRGAKAKDASTFAFEDRSGLLEWRATDRATLTLRNMQDVDTHEQALRGLVREWIAVTADQSE